MELKTKRRLWLNYISSDFELQKNGQTWKKCFEIWVNMNLGVKSMSDLALKEIYGTYERKDLADEKLENKKWLKKKVLESKMI